MAMGHGGARPGAGRKPKLEKNVTAIEKAEEQIRDRLPQTINKLFELAEGVTVEEKDELGNRVVYTRPPDRVSCIYLINRIMGKPEVRVKAEHSGEVAWISRVKQLDALADPMALELLCELEARLSLPSFAGDDGCEMGALDFGG